MSSYSTKFFFYNLLSSPIFLKTPFYRYLFYKDIKEKICVLKYKPLAVIIENTNFCNISCIFCPNEQMHRKRGFIDNQVFKKIIDQCAFYKIPTVVVQGFGEPLLDKDYVSKIRYAKQKNIKNIHCVTNGILLNKDTAEMLIDSGLDYLNISIDAATPQVYGEIHRLPKSGSPSNQFFDVVNNIDFLIKLREKSGSKKPFIEVRFKDFEKNKTDLGRFIKKYKRKVDRINIYMNITNWPGSNIKNNIPKTKILRFPCFNLWSTLFVTYDGRVALCCQDYECSLQIGDAIKEDIMHIWNGELLEKARKLHLEGKFGQINTCTDCVINSHYVTPWWPI